MNFDTDTHHLLTILLTHHKKTLSFANSLHHGTTKNDDQCDALSSARSSSRAQSHLAKLNDVALSPDARLVLTCSEDTTAMIWDIDDVRDLICALEENSSALTSSGKMCTPQKQCDEKKELGRTGSHRKCTTGSVKFHFPDPLSILHHVLDEAMKLVTISHSSPLHHGGYSTVKGNVTCMLPPVTGCFIDSMRVATVTRCRHVSVFTLDFGGILIHRINLDDMSIPPCPFLKDMYKSSTFIEDFASGCTYHPHLDGHATLLLPINGHPLLLLAVPIFTSEPKIRMTGDEERLRWSSFSSSACPRWIAVSAPSQNSEQTPTTAPSSIYNRWAISHTIATRKENNNTSVDESAGTTSNFQVQLNLTMYCLSDGKDAAGLSCWKISISGVRWRWGMWDMGYTMLSRPISFSTKQHNRNQGCLDEPDQKRERMDHRAVRKVRIQTTKVSKSNVHAASDSPLSHLLQERDAFLKKQSELICECINLNENLIIMKKRRLLRSTME